MVWMFWLVVLMLRGVAVHCAMHVRLQASFPKDSRKEQAEHMASPCFRGGLGLVDAFVVVCGSRCVCGRCDQGHCDEHVLWAYGV
jgi:hypothetical protein